MRFILLTLLIVISLGNLVWEKKHYIKENMKYNEMETYKIPQTVEEIKLKVICVPDCNLYLVDEFGLKNLTKNLEFESYLVEFKQTYIRNHFYNKMALKKGLTLVIKNANVDLLDIKVYLRTLNSKLTYSEAKSTLFYGMFAIFIFCMINCFLLLFLLLLFIFGSIWCGREKEIYKLLQDIGISNKELKDE